MSDYTKTTNFTAKDSLPSGNPSKIVKGSEIDTELSAIATAVNSKADELNPALSGTITLAASTVISTNSVSVSDAELGYLDGVTSNIQTQINTKAPSASPTFTGTVTLPATTSIDTVSATEISYLNGVTSAIQTQIDTKAPTASPALTGTPTAPTAAAGTNTTQLATTAFVQSTAFNSALPVQTGNAGKYVTTDGSNASWVAISQNVYDDATYWMGI